MTVRYTEEDLFVHGVCALAGLALSALCHASWYGWAGAVLAGANSVFALNAFRDVTGRSAK